MSRLADGSGIDHDLTVVICTYNGERHVGQQVASALWQTLRPARILISDDGSTDSTVQAATTAFTDGHGPDLGVQLDVIRTPSGGAGIAENLAFALGHVQTPFVAIADQDDVWMPNRLAAGRAALSHGSAVSASDALLVSDQLTPLGGSVWSALGYGPVDRKLLRADKVLGVLLRGNLVPGMTMTARTEFLLSCLPVPPGWMHDYWFALNGAIERRLVLLDTPLVLYRQHQQNQVGLDASERAPERPLQALLRRSRNALQMSRSGADRESPLAVWSEEIVSRLQQRAVDPADAARVRAKYAFSRDRRTLPVSPKQRLPRVLAHVARRSYWTFLRRPLHSLLLDLASGVPPADCYAYRSTQKS